MGLVRKNILSLVPYKAGKPIEEVERELRLKNVIKLASNENPLGPSPKAVESIKNNLFKINRYPDAGGFYLKRKIAEFYKLNPSNIVLGNGSDELIDIIIKTFVEEDENIITAEITFLEYSIIAKAIGRKIYLVPLKNFRYDLKEMMRRINKKTKLIFIANPNNPTGTYVDRVEFENFINGLSDSVIVVLDEAYDTFIDVDDFPKGINYINKKNVIVLKTFSKAYGLAGLRLGFAIANKKFSQYMERVRQPFNVNYFAQIAGIAALEDKGFLEKTRTTILEGKYYLYNALEKLGLNYIPSVANFILIDVKMDGEKLFKEMLRYGVIVRDLKQYGLNNFIRVTIGKKEENEKFIKVLRKLI
ncbi:MAG: histidinol-phosphate transaminase [Candidatus Omnitrophica bacterium]|nr:histidinol-phosphate transaminase [Candidatus Omnitrophota bacterium]